VARTARSHDWTLHPIQHNKRSTPRHECALGTLVTLSLRGRDRHEATVVAIEQNYWPREWAYMIWIEEIGKPPELLMTILDRGSLNSQDISTCISPRAIMLTDGDTAIFFNELERPTQVTIIQKGSPGFYETVRIVTPLQAKLSPRMKVEDIEHHRLFTVDMSPPDTAKPREEAQPGQTLKSITNWGPKNPWNTTSDTKADTATNQAPLAIKSNPYLEAGNLEATELAKLRAATAMVEGEREFLPMGRHTAVIQKKRRPRGTSRQKILIKWRNYTIPCTYSDRLTPATLIEDIGKSPWASPEALVKATLTPPNNPLETMLLDTPLRMQGIVKGDTLTLLVRHAKIHDPYDVQHFVAYREEDTIQYFLAALWETSSIPTLSEIIICHKGLCLDPANRFKDCNLPHEPTLHVRFSSHPDAHPRNEPEQTESAGEANDSTADPTNTFPPKDRCRGTQPETRDTGKAKGELGMALSISPSQAFVQDPKGKENSRLALQPTGLHSKKSDAPLFSAPPPTLNGAVHPVQ